MPEPPAKKYLGFEALTWAKIIPLGAMFFCILFNYTILRDTKVRPGAENTWNGEAFFHPFVRGGGPVLTAGVRVRA